MPNLSASPRLTWLPSWFKAHESLWSVAAKLTTANVCQLEDVFEFVPPLGQLQYSLWNLDDPTVGIELGKYLKLPLKDLSTAFIQDFLVLPEYRLLFNHSLRYCPRCLASGFHSVLFQHRGVVRCPLHNAAISESCPRCFRPILCAKGNPWCCAYCGSTLGMAATGAGWLRQFGESIDPAAFAALRRHIRNAMAPEWEFWMARTSRIEFGASLELTGYSLEDWRNVRGVTTLARWYWNEVLSIFGTFFQVHWPCLAEWPNPQLGHGGLTRVFCPAATAAAAVLKHLEFPSLTSLESWQDRYSRDALELHLVNSLHAPSEESYLNPSVAEYVVRAIARCLFGNALMAYMANPSSGHGRWQPNASGPQAYWRLTGDRLVVYSPANVELFRELSEDADRACPGSHKSVTSRTRRAR